LRGVFVIKLSVEDFVFEVKEEILSYEDLGEEKAAQWEKDFLRWLENTKIKKKNIKEKENKKFYLIKDESQIFDIVDEYFDAVEQKREKEYWKKFQ